MRRVLALLLLAPAAAPQPAAPSRALGIERALTDVVRKVRPAVVAIAVVQELDVQGVKRPALAGAGSGVIISESGDVLTNDHVAGEAARVVVVLTGGRREDAEVVARDRQGDLALLRLPTGRYPSVELGRADRAQVGDWVLAMGNPFWLGEDGEPCVALGVLSGKGRVVQGKWLYGNSLQTDAEVNPGNSGGPLFDLEGRLIGINGMISTRHGFRANTGVGYAITIEQIRNFLPSMKRGQDAAHAWLGLDFDPEFRGPGASIRGIHPASPGQGKLRAGDVVVSVDGRTVGNPTQFTNIVSVMAAGREVALSIRREGRPRTVRLKLAPAPDR
jgi:S1-C subfamily serine protease